MDGSSSACSPPCLLTGCECVHIVKSDIKLLLAKDAIYFPKWDYVDTVQKDGMTWKMRATVVWWFVRLARKYDQSRDVVSHAINLLDRYLSLVSCSPKDLKLASTACIIMSSKLLADQTTLKMAEICQHCDENFKTSDVQCMELKILEALNYYLQPALPYDFLQAVVSFFPTPELYLRAEGLLDKSHCVHLLLKYPPATKALAASVYAFYLRECCRSTGLCSCIRSFLAQASAIGLVFEKSTQECLSLMKRFFNHSQINTSNSSCCLDLAQAPTCLSTRYIVSEWFPSVSSRKRPRPDETQSV
uniref:Cyclin-like domain-containing protein n=1 Tax=Fibrocapsa japonica TaxID=94617 RepID=A0A7S2V874_9STRA